jgi:NADPH:quinone reductase
VGVHVHPAMYQTTDMHKQSELLNTIAAWIDDKNLRTTLTETLSPICAANLRKAHATMESGLSIGKIVLEGFLINNRKNGKH